jgi:hypothetical protein
MKTQSMNHLYFGGCLDVLKEIKEGHPQPFIDFINTYKKNQDAVISNLALPNSRWIKYKSSLSKTFLTTNNPCSPAPPKTKLLKRRRGMRGKSASKGLFD